MFNPLYQSALIPLSLPLWASLAVGIFAQASMMVCWWSDSLWAKDTIHVLTTMLATSKDILFQGHNHLLTTGADDPTL